MWLGRLIFVGILIGMWQLSSGRWTDPLWVSSPSRILAQEWTWWRDGTLPSNTWVTVEETVTGFIIGVPAGVLAAFALGTSTRTADILEPLVIALYNIPKLALAPLFILWFGIGIAPKVVLVALVTFFLIFINTLSGVRAIDRDLINSIRILGARPLQLFVKLILPQSLHWILTGVKISLPYALTAAVAGEMMVSQRGLGYLASQSGLMLDMTGVYAALAVLMAIGVAADAAVGGTRTIMTDEAAGDTLQT